jgi:anti-sigma factor RsiW
MKKPCSLFDRYRDGMLDPAEARRFESHLDSCPSCRGRRLLLDNLAHLVREEEIGTARLASRAIAGRAFDRGRSWDVLLLSWLRPVPVWSGLAALALLLLLFGAGSLGPAPEPAGLDALLATAGPERPIEELGDAEMESWLTGGDLR